MSTTTRFRFLSEFHIHFLDALIKETGVIASIAVANHVVQGIKNQHLTIGINSAVLHA
jgi:hypothetical protein